VQTGLGGGRTERFPAFASEAVRLNGSGFVNTLARNGAVVQAGEPARRHRNTDVGRAGAGQCNANDFTAPRAPCHSIPLT